MFDAQVHILYTALLLPTSFIALNFPSVPDEDANEIMTMVIEVVSIHKVYVYAGSPIVGKTSALSP
jgi:hypothetical protein